MKDLPYISANALLSTADDALVYVLQPAISPSIPTQLLVFNSSTTLRSPSLPFRALTNQLPFIEDYSGTSYVPAIDSEGRIYVYSGKCDGGASKSKLWLYEPSQDDLDANGEWSMVDVSTQGGGNAGLDGANYLAAGVAFANPDMTADMYIFGGMCPNSTGTTAENWTDSAAYSNSMLTLKPDESTGTGIYSLSISASRGPPIPEAGFTMTPLLPSFTHFDGGDDKRRRAQEYVLLGGHTQAAFINMSQAALFSLPEQTWSFLQIDMPDEQPTTELTTRDVPSIEPRSGHTAVLTADGKRIIMYGGWVGDIDTPAYPQLVTLELGEDYGGDGDWRWSIPDQKGSGPGTFAGVYGHGAVMLPGDVMMIIGGYTIPASKRSKWKRAAADQNAEAYFFNTTSSTWISEYTNPNLESKHSSSATPNSGSINASKRAGLGAGLVFGVLAILAIAVFYFWYARRLKRKREAREDDLRDLGSGGHQSHWSGPASDGQNGEMIVRELRDAYPWNNDHVVVRHNEPMSDTPRAQRTGLLFEIPSPTRGLRRSLHSRGAYQPAPRYEDGRQNVTYSNIHPIDERDEYEDEVTDRPEYHVLRSAPVLDPFQDTGDGSRSPSPQSPAREREVEIQKWVNDWAAADARMQHQAGRLSPDKTDRTSSTLSEQSVRSTWSGPSVGSFGRSLSQRSAALFSHAYPSTNPTTTASLANGLHSAAPLSNETTTSHGRSQSLTGHPRRKTTSDVMDNGANSIRQLQQESEALLGGYTDAGPSSPTRTHSRARGWVGSVRRAFGTDRSASTSPVHGGSSTSSSPTKLHHDTGIPRRAVSAGAALWQRKQGAKDWDAEGSGTDRGRLDSSGMNDEEGEWDVESAVENRVVQVMFTVPKEKLRVVNGAPEGDGDSVLSTEIRESEGGRDEKGKGKEKQRSMDD
ncbi:MAG: hypothetical protein Q9174_000467 [Haloplaca sp. 1 TL-2023]